jgi:hypothetical protein
MPDTTSIGLLINTIDPSTNNFLNPVSNPDSLIAKRFVHPARSTTSYSTGLSSVQVLENNHVLMFSGRFGYGYELDATGNIVWEYRVPLKAGETVPQGTILSVNDNITFQMKRYTADFEGFNGKDLSPKGLLEEITIEEIITDIGNDLISNSINIYPNPFEQEIHIESTETLKQLEVYNLSGVMIYKKTNPLRSAMLDTSQFKKGLYFIKINNKVIYKLVKY